MVATVRRGNLPYNVDKTGFQVLNEMSKSLLNFYIQPFSIKHQEPAVYEYFSMRIHITRPVQLFTRPYSYVFEKNVSFIFMNTLYNKLSGNKG